jgi:hypothetical protein
MPLGSVNITLRPVRLAFLVDPADTRGIMEAIELNSFLWGRMFNPIVPIYGRTPKKWQSKFERTTAREVSAMLPLFRPSITMANFSSALLWTCAFLGISPPGGGPES